MISYLFNLSQNHNSNCPTTTNNVFPNLKSIHIKRVNLAQKAFLGMDIMLTCGKYGHYADKCPEPPRKLKKKGN
jgi:hypothetical protein